jgi:hypothetical protein
MAKKERIQDTATVVWDALNPAVMHHLRHVERALNEMQRIHTIGESINVAYRDVYASMRDSYMAGAQSMYWLHCWRLSQLENGTYS